MKVVAAALVLVVGAAVVLWFGNTLNSWVLGGLIGGLAAILLSIPISLVLFSYLSRRRDEQLRADLREDEYPEVYEYEDAPVRVVHRTYAARATRSRPALKRSGPKRMSTISSAPWRDRPSVVFRHPGPSA